MKSIGYGAYGMTRFGDFPLAGRSPKTIIASVRAKLYGKKKGYRFLHGLGQEFAPNQQQLDAAKSEWKAAIKALNKAKTAAYETQELKEKGIAKAQARFDKARKTLKLLTEEAAEEAEYQIEARAKRRAERTKKQAPASSTAVVTAAPLAPAAAAPKTPPPPPPTTPAAALPPPPPTAAFAPPPVMVVEREDESFGLGPIGNMAAAGVAGLILAGILFRR